MHLPALIAGVFGLSSSEARRLIAQGGVKLDGESVPPERLDLPPATSAAASSRWASAASFGCSPLTPLQTIRRGLS